MAQDRYDADDLVIDCSDIQVGKRWPRPVHRRLEELVERARAIGERTSGPELLSAIVCAFEVSDEEYRRVLRSYRTSRVRDVVSTPADAGNVIELPRKKAGRPTSA
jgi:hypothetical protein